MLVKIRNRVNGSQSPAIENNVDNLQARGMSKYRQTAPNLLQHGKFMLQTEIWVRIYQVKHSASVNQSEHMN